MYLSRHNLIPTIMLFIANVSLPYDIYAAEDNSWKSALTSTIKEHSPAAIDIYIDDKDTLGDRLISSQPRLPVLNVTYKSAPLKIVTEEQSLPSREQSFKSLSLQENTPLEFSGKLVTSPTIAHKAQKACGTPCSLSSQGLDQGIFHIYNAKRSDLKKIIAVAGQESILFSGNARCVTAPASSLSISQ